MDRRAGSPWALRGSGGAPGDIRLLYLMCAQPPLPRPYPGLAGALSPNLPAIFTREW